MAARAMSTRAIQSFLPELSAASRARSNSALASRALVSYAHWALANSSAARWACEPANKASASFSLRPIDSWRLSLSSALGAASSAKQLSSKASAASTGLPIAKYAELQASQCASAFSYSPDFPACSAESASSCAAKCGGSSPRSSSSSSIDAFARASRPR